MQPAPPPRLSTLHGRRNMQTRDEIAAMRRSLQNIEALLFDVISAYMAGTGQFKAVYADKREATHKRGAGGYHSPAQWKALKGYYEFTCLCCRRREPEITLTRDHVKPITKGGSNLIENIQPLCKPCNSWKHDKEIDYR